MRQSTKEDEQGVSFKKLFAGTSFFSSMKKLEEYIANKELQTSSYMKFEKKHDEHVKECRSRYSLLVHKKQAYTQKKDESKTLHDKLKKANDINGQLLKKIEEMQNNLSGKKVKQVPKEKPKKLLKSILKKDDERDKNNSQLKLLDRSINWHIDVTKDANDLKNDLFDKKMRITKSGQTNRKNSFASGALSATIQANTGKTQTRKRSSANLFDLTCFNEGVLDAHSESSLNNSAFGSFSVDKVGRTVSIHSNDNEEKRFDFDHVFDDSGTQVEVFETFGKRIVDGCLDGINGTIFVYGQTGSGKTWTMLGPMEDELSDSDNQGLIQRCVSYLLTKLEENKESGAMVDFTVRCQCVQLYKESLFDLQCLESKKLAVRDLPQGIIIEGATMSEILNPTTLIKLLKKTWKNRIVSETAMNAESSRSHGIFIFDIEMKETHGDVTTIKKARFNLVDLAGSERVKVAETTGDRLLETGAINKSLLQLGRVIRSLAQHTTGHIGYRDSLLTQLLRDSLGGNARTAVIVNCHSDSKHSDETLSSLLFAMNCKKIINKAKINEDVQCKGFSAYVERIRMLEQQLAVFTEKSDVQGDTKNPLIEEYEDLIANKANLEDMIAKRNEDLQKISSILLKREADYEKAVVSYQTNITELKVNLSEISNLRALKTSNKSKRRRAMYVPNDLQETVEQAKEELNKTVPEEEFEFEQSRRISFEMEEIKVNGSVYDDIVIQIKEMKDSVSRAKSELEFSELLTASAVAERNEWENKYDTLADENKANIEELQQWKQKYDTLADENKANIEELQEWKQKYDSLLKTTQNAVQSTDEKTKPRKKAKKDEPEIISPTKDIPLVDDSIRRSTRPRRAINKSIAEK
uniref:Kinesin-like protein n=1 Tax=Rhabditophanes sp. KR3021 TaxID=114890 RepID=A0AC35U9Q1_9BILA